jgi:hypothetical protein
MRTLVRECRSARHSTTCSSQNCYHIFSLTLPHCTALHITYLSECCSHSNRVSVYRSHRSLTVDPHTDTHSTQAVILTHFTALTHHDTLIPYSVHSPLQADHCNLTADISTHVYPQLLDRRSACSILQGYASYPPRAGRAKGQYLPQIFATAPLQLNQNPTHTQK